MNLRVTVAGKVKGHETCSRSESESEQGFESVVVDAKPSDLPLFGPPSGVTQTSTWTRVDHLVSRLLLPTGRPIKTRFRFGSVLHST